MRKQLLILSTCGLFTFALAACDAPSSPVPPPPLAPTRVSAESQPAAILVTDTPARGQTALPVGAAGTGGKQNPALRLEAKYIADAGVLVTWQGTCSGGVSAYEVAFLPADLLEQAGGKQATNIKLDYQALGRVAVQGDNCGAYRFNRTANVREARGVYIVRTLGADGAVTSFSNQVPVQ